MLYDTTIRCTEQSFSDDTAMPASNHKILVVEDNLLNQKVTRILLEDLGYQVEIAENGTQALEKFNAEYSMVFMDVGLPDIDGCTVCKQLRQTEQGKSVPIVALTANGENFKEKCLAAGMDSYLTKPIMIDELKNLLMHYLAT